MSIAIPSLTTADDDPPARRATGEKRRRRWPAHVLVAVLALALAVYVTQGLWRDPQNYALTENVGDQAFFEWALAYGVQLFAHGGNPFFTTMMGWPLGANLAANTSVTVDAILFAPVTRLAGAQVSFLLVLTLNLAGSAFAWYLFLSRWVVRHRLAAAIGGFFCGFAPGFVAHANGHLNWTSGWIAPLVLWRLFALRTGRRWALNGAVLGVLLAAGFTIAAEGLFFTALAAAIFLAAWLPGAALRPVLPSALKGLAVGAVVAGALLAYPLYLHFAGPQTFGATGFSQRDYSEDLASYFNYADRSLASATVPGLRNQLAPNPAEQTSFFGLPLIVLVVVAMALLWWRATLARRALLRSLTIVGLVFVVLSLGPRLHWFGKVESFPLPYAFLAKLPLFDAALPLRFALVVAAVFGIVLALAAEKVLTARPRPWVRATVAAGFVLALVPLFPMPLHYMVRTPEPKFIADGTWERYVPDGGVMSALPFAINVAADAQRWQAYTMARGGKQFRIPDGYFLGPESPASAAAQGRTELKGRIGPTPRPTDWLFLRAAIYGYLSTITNNDREAAREDFAYWNIDAVFLPDTITGPGQWLYHSALEITATDLLGRPERVDDVLVWRIRPGVDPVDR